MGAHWRFGLKVQRACGRLPEGMDSTRAGLVGTYDVLHKVRQRKGTVRIWVDNDNVVRGLGERLGIERADAVWAVAENWAGGTKFKLKDLYHTTANSIVGGCM